MYIMYIFIGLYMQMTAVSIAEFRKNMASYLDEVKYKRKPLLLGKRNTPDFIIIPALSEEDREMFKSTNFWKELEDARKTPSIPWDEAKKILGLE